MDKPTMYIQQCGRATWNPIGEIGDFNEPDKSIIDYKTNPYTSHTVTVHCEANSHWPEITEMISKTLKERISRYREEMENMGFEAQRRLFFGDFAVENSPLPKLESISEGSIIREIQKRGRGLRDPYAGDKACEAWHMLKRSNPEMSFQELLAAHQDYMSHSKSDAQVLTMSFTEIEPETKTVQYRGFTFTDVPGWVKYVTTDYYGDIYGYENKPKFLDVAAVWTNVGGGRDCRLHKALVKGAFAPDKSMVEV